jgi:hypothetical protein
MKDKQLFAQYEDLIREIVQDEVKKILREGNFFRSVTGTVVKGSSDGSSYDVDIVDTQLKGIANKSGHTLSAGDTVTIMERYGSNYSNCYISVVNGASGNKTFDKMGEN